MNIVAIVLRYPELADTLADLQIFADVLDVPDPSNISGDIGAIVQKQGKEGILWIIRHDPEDKEGSLALATSGWNIVALIADQSDSGALGTTDNIAYCSLPWDAPSVLAMISELPGIDMDQDELWEKLDHISYSDNQSESSPVVDTNEHPLPPPPVPEAGILPPAVEILDDPSPMQQPVPEAGILPPAVEILDDPFPMQQPVPEAGILPPAVEILDDPSPMQQPGSGDITNGYHDNWALESPTLALYNDGEVESANATLSTPTILDDQELDLMAGVPIDGDVHETPIEKLFVDAVDTSDEETKEVDNDKMASLQDMLGLQPGTDDLADGGHTTESVDNFLAVLGISGTETAPAVTTPTAPIHASTTSVAQPAAHASAPLPVPPVVPNVPVNPPLSTPTSTTPIAPPLPPVSPPLPPPPTVMSAPPVQLPHIVEDDLDSMSTSPIEVTPPASPPDSLGAALGTGWMDGGDRDHVSAPPPPPPPVSGPGTLPPPPPGRTMSDLLHNQGITTPAPQTFSVPSVGGLVAKDNALGRVIATVVPKGGTGKTSFTITAAIRSAEKLYQQGKKVCLVEANVQQANISRYLGVSDSVITLGAIAREHVIDRDTVRRVITTDNAYHLDILFGPSTFAEADPRILTPKFYRQVVQQLIKDYDYVWIDAQSAEGFATMFTDFIIPMADRLMVVLNHNQVAIDQTLEYLQGITSPRHNGVGHAVPMESVGIVLNQYRDNAKLSLNDIRAQLNAWTWWGHVPWMQAWADANSEYRIYLDKEVYKYIDPILYSALGGEVAFSPSHRSSGVDNPSGGFMRKLLKK